ncbi:MAG: hypothetical protein WD225_06240 [Ilumatobacteraceae bacterium]
MAPRWHRGELAVVAVVLIVTFLVVVLLVRRPGHWWGDDWALYVRQAWALTTGNVDTVIADNRFTVEQSGPPAFSPPMYPWGFAILLAPFVAVLGTDLDRLVIAQALFFCWFLAAWYRLARPRVGPGLAIGGLVVLAASPQFVRWAELIQSELAYMAVSLTALVVLDRDRVRRALVPSSLADRASAPWWPPVAMGLLGAAAFNVRREGLAVMAAIAVTQLVLLARSPGARQALWRRSSATGRTRQVDVRLLARLAVPYAVALGTVGVLQIVLPTTLVPGYEGNGLHNVVRFAPDHLGHVMEAIGLQPILSGAPDVFGSHALGVAAVALFVGLTVCGVIVAARFRPVPDLPLVAFTIGALAIGGSFRVPGSRYVAVIAPMTLLLALLAVRWLSGRFPQRRIVAGSGLALVTLLAAGNVVEVGGLAADARRFERDGHVVWGADAPPSLEMFDAVERLTDPDDVIGFFKPRAMTQRTDRRAIKIDGYRPVDRNLDVITHVVVEHRPDPAHAVTVDPDRPTELWSNTHFTLHRTHPHPPPPEN